MADGPYKGAIIHGTVRSVSLSGHLTKLILRDSSLTVMTHKDACIYLPRLHFALRTCGL